MRKLLIIIFLNLPLFFYGQNSLSIPPAISGPVFNLNVQSGTKVFYGTKSTPTYGINGNWLGPTIIANKGDSITLNVKNSLNVKTTMHWHGLHVAAKNDGGPHQIILPSSTWSPSFNIINNAATYWYHPHGAGQTDPQVSKGLAGFFIVKDSDEAKLNIPRTYGVDDIPLVIQSKAFDDLTQIAISSELDTALFLNGTLNAYFDAPQQVIRFRLLNGSSLRTYNLGFSNGQKFYQIATDGGMLDSTIEHTRIRVSPGERAEILVNFSGMLNQKLYLMSYSSELPNGIYGAAKVGNGNDTINEYGLNHLNGSDFNLLQINVVAATANPISTIPSALVNFSPLNVTSANKTRTIIFDTIRLLPADIPNRAAGPFGINNSTFNMDSINEVVYLNSTEIWKLVNHTQVAHPFHIHDVQFNIVERSGMPPSTLERGWKDVVLVMPGDSVKFITRFSDFADSKIPYMYHCHLLHHEDDGMMGSFLVIDSLSSGLTDVIPSDFQIYPNPVKNILYMKFLNFTPDRKDITITNTVGEALFNQTFEHTQYATMDLSALTTGIYFAFIKSGDKVVCRKFIKE